MIGYLRCKCIIYDAQSLKQKRSVVKSVTTRLKQRLNVSVSELRYHELWQQTELGIVTIAVDQKRAEQELQKAIKIVDNDERMEIIETIYEWL